MGIKDTIKMLKAQRKALNNTPDKQAKKTLDTQIATAEIDKLDQQKKKKEEEKKQLIAEAHSIIVKTYGTLKRLGLIKTKWDMSDLFNRSRSYYLVLENRANATLPYESIRALKENIQEIKYNLHLLLEEEDETYKDWVRRKLDEILTDIERLELKTMGVLYGL